MPNLTDTQFTRIYHDHARHVMCAARRLGVSPENLPDVAQEVWLLASRRLPDLDLSQPLGPWLTHVVWHLVQHQRRSYARHARRLQALTAAHPSEPAAEPYTRGEAAWTLEPALDDLPDEQRAVLLSSDYEGMTAREISEALGIGLNTVYSRLRLARQRCRESITTPERRRASQPRRSRAHEPAAH
jgi:RNA polymerase sigma factor (sigma-70 family)